VRDVERLREKIELSLDDRQVIAVAICALLLLAGVFSLGLLLGRKLSSTQPQAAVAGELAAFDAQARKPDGQAARPTEKLHTVEKPEPVRASSIVPAPPRTTTVVPPPPTRPVQVPQPSPVALTPPPKETGDFTVQVGASQDRVEAARLEARVRGAGLKPYVVEANLGEKGTWYRVRVGAFRDKEAASRFRVDVERELRTVAVVMPAR
jgi:cell division septation protein DedD